jgi:hypothetical protein
MCGSSRSRSTNESRCLPHAWPTLSLVWLIGAYALVFGVPLLVSATRFKNALGGIPEPAAAV